MNKQTVMLLAVVALGFSHVACQIPSNEADVEAIKKLVVEDFVEAENAGDVSAKVALYTDDAVLMPPNEPAVTGKEAIHSWHQTTYNQVSLQVTDSTDEIAVSGDWGFARGSYSATISLRAGGEPTRENGKFLVIVRRQPDGSWKIVCDMWNSDTPPPDVQ